MSSGTESGESGESPPSSPLSSFSSLSPYSAASSSDSSSNHSSKKDLTSSFEKSSFDGENGHDSDESAGTDDDFDEVDDNLDEFNQKFDNFDEFLDKNRDNPDENDETFDHTRTQSNGIKNRLGMKPHGTHSANENSAKNEDPDLDSANGDLNPDDNPEEESDPEANPRKAAFLPLFDSHVAGCDWLAQEKEQFFGIIGRLGKRNMASTFLGKKGENQIEGKTMLQIFEYKETLQKAAEENPAPKARKRARLTREAVEVTDEDLEKEIREAELKVEKLDRPNKKPRKKFKKNARLFHTENFQNLTRDIYMEDESGQIEIAVYGELHSALVLFLKPIIERLALMAKLSKEASRRGKKGYTCHVISEEDLKQVLEETGQDQQKDTYFRRLMEDRVLPSDAILLGGEPRSENERSANDNEAENVSETESERSISPLPRELSSSPSSRSSSPSSPSRSSSRSPSPSPSRSFSSPSNSDNSEISDSESDT